MNLSAGHHRSYCQPDVNAVNLQIQQQLLQVGLAFIPCHRHKRVLYTVADSKLQLTSQMTSRPTRQLL